MKKVLVVVLVLVVGIGALGYYLKWFTFEKKDGKTTFVLHPEKFKKDKDAVALKAKALKDKMLKTKTAELTGKDKEEFEALSKEHDTLEKQISELENLEDAKFDEDVKTLQKSLDDVDKKLDALNKKLEKPKKD